MGGEQNYPELERLKGKIRELRRSRRRGGRPRPHKLVLLLAVLDMAEDGLLGQNRIPFDDSMTTRFERYFDHYKQQDDRCHPSLPFFHLKTSGFWYHKVRTGKEAAYGRLGASSVGSKDILETIEYAHLSDYALELVNRETTRRELRAFIERLLETEG